MKDALQTQDLVELFARFRAVMGARKEFLIELDGKVANVLVNVGRTCP